jgi:hypothetical protein
MYKQPYRKESSGGEFGLGTAILPFEPALHPKLETLDRLHLPVVAAVQIPFRGPNMGMPHQRLNGFEIVFSGFVTKDDAPESMVEVGSDEKDQSKADKRKDPVKRFKEGQVVDKDL